MPSSGAGTRWPRSSPRCRLGLADSEFNRAEIAANGYRPTAVAPILLDLEGFDREVDERVLAELEQGKQKGGADWLFVGRVTPNKCQHDVVKAFAAYRMLHDPNARLHIVGGVASEPYAAALRAFVRKLGLSDCVSLTGPVSPGGLAAYYRAADVYVCLSEHEGFCVPLLESMHFGVPIVAFGVTAVPETLGRRRHLPSRQVTCPRRRSGRPCAERRGLAGSAVAAGERRLRDFTLERSRARFLEAMAPVLS